MGILVSCSVSQPWLPKPGTLKCFLPCPFFFPLGGLWASLCALGPEAPPIELRTVTPDGEKGRSKGLPLTPSRVWIPILSSICRVFLPAHVNLCPGSSGEPPASSSLSSSATGWFSLPGPPSLLPVLLVSSSSVPDLPVTLSRGLVLGSRRGLAPELG